MYLGHSCLEEELCHGCGGGVSGRECDRRDNRVAGTSLKREYHFQTVLLECSDAGYSNYIQEIQLHTLNNIIATE